MELSDELLEQIGAYLSGQLSVAEKDQFETRLQQDPILQQEVALQRELKVGLSFLSQKERFRQLHTDLSKRGLLTDIDRQTELQSTRPELPITAPKTVPLPSSRPIFRYGLASWAMAASLVLLLGIGWVLYRNQTEKRQTLAQNERHFNDFFSTNLKPTPGIATDPDRLAASPDNNTSVQDSVRLRSAVDGMKGEGLQPVINELTILSTGRPGHWTASAQWYLALALLKNNQPTEARSRLQIIAQLNGHPYQQEAQRLLNQLTSPVPPSQP